MKVIARWLVVATVVVHCGIGCSQKTKPDGEDTDLVKVYFSFKAEGAAEAATVLTGVSKDTAPKDFQQSLAELHRRVSDGANMISSALSAYCTRELIVARTLPLGSCVATKQAAEALSRADRIEVDWIGPAETRIQAFAHRPADETISFAFSDLAQTQALDSVLGAGTRIGIVEFSECDRNGDVWRVDESVAALRNADVHHLNHSRRQFGFNWPHMHLVTTAMTHYHEASRARDTLPEASFYVANLALTGALQSSPCNPMLKSSLLQAMDWFVAEGVRLVNRSSYSVQLWDACQAPLYGDERVVDIYARTFDIVVTSAAGQTQEEDDTDCPVYCDAQNQTCVGAVVDQDHGNVQNVGDLRDDLWTFSELEDGSREHYLFEDPEEQDREEPDVVAPAQVVTSIPQSDQMALPSGTSLSSPLVLALLAKQLEVVSASGTQPWTACRVSEFMRAAVTFASGSHPVEVNGERVRTAAHDHMISGNRTGLVSGAECRSPDQCEAGLTCLFGVCSEPPRDEKAGWGMASPLQSILDGQWACNASGGSRSCGLSQDGNCKERTRPRDAVDPREFGALDSPEPPPGKIGIAQKGYQLLDTSLAEGDVYRGALAWSSCPVAETFGSISCSSDADCPQFHSCSAGFGTCQQTFSERRKIPAVDFDVQVYELQTGEGLWLSYSSDDVTEAFEFVAPRSGDYSFWAFPDREDWDCDESEFNQTNEDGEFMVFIGGTVP